MDILPGLILGAVQGLTEFLPISSSGHLILVRSVLGLGEENGLAVDAVLQLATALAVAIYFRRDLVRLARAAVRLVARRPVESAERTMLAALAVGTVPAVIAGLLLEDYMDTAFRSASLVAVTLLAGAALMWLAERLARQDRALSWRRGLAVGLFQCLALVPGVSRSGATISGGLFAGLKRDDAARFSFLLSFPVVAGSGLKKFADLASQGALADLGLGLAVGFAAALVFGLLAIHFLIGYLRTHSLSVFVWYRVALAAAWWWGFSVLST